jgi:amino acid adenylation domain-containing protein
MALAEGVRDHRLVAYYAAAGSATDAAAGVTAAELRAFLRERLPEPMVPAAFIPVASLPLTANGKVDRRALPPPEEPPAGEPAAAPRATPRDPIEEVIAGIWRELLGLDRPVGVHDDFFHLGGQSLLATRLLSRIYRALGVELPVQALFELPTVAGLSAAVRRAGRPTALPPLVPLARREGSLPLSYAQQRLWFLDRLAPGSPLYNVPAAYLLRGPLAPAALAAALAEIVRRHAALRTRFVEVAGEPRQEVEPPRPLPLPRVDLSGLAGARNAELARLRAAEAERPFDLARDPLLRAGLVHLGGDEHALLLSLHHIVYDGWSEGVLLRELSALYAAAIEGAPSPLGELPVQYADFAAWQRAWPAEALERQLAYWRDQLAGAPAALELPADHPRPAAQSFRGASRGLHIPAETAARLRQAAAREGATLYMLLLAGFAGLLSRYSGQEDLLIGAPAANRTRPEIEGLIGFFVNTLVLRTRVEGEAEFRRLLAAARDAVLGAFAHQDLPFETLVEELRPERDLSRSPLVQVLLLLQSAGRTAAAGRRGLSFARLPSIRRTTAKLDLILAVEDEEGDGALALEVEYAEDLFTASTAARLLAHYATLLGGAAAAPETPLSRLPLLAEAERHQLVAEWNDTASAYPRRAVHRLFEEQAAARPQAVAVAWDDGVLTYGELDRRAGRIARRLRRLGVGPEARVALSAQRSAEMVAAVVGILKAGGGYLPLDPSYPRERLELLLADAAPAAVVGPRQLLAALPGTAPRLAYEDVETAAAEVGGDAGDEVPPEGLAYVLYTSGSTGAPKGVEVSHGAVVRLVREAGYGAFGPGEVFLQLVPMSFDVATFELWGPLLHGGRLALLPPGPFALRDLYAAVARHGVTTLWLTSGLFHLAAEEGLEGLAGLRQLFSGGDALSRSHVERALAALPRVEIVDGYGPTENTTFSTTHRLRSGLGEGSVPIGRPVAASRAYVLDRRLAPLPVGCAGELCVGGAGLARGYLGRPALTAERFVPDPFGGGRLYRTGDLARWRPDGTLEFLGRRDFQVKVRGFRIEPGEVESALVAHPRVREAVVVALAEGVRDHRLVAYYVADAAGGASAGELRAFLRARLPEHMVPAAFVALGSLPLTPNGKVDRRALPAPEELPSGGSGEAGAAAAPRSPLEEVVAGIFEEVLGLDRPIGIHDNFFHLGGHSLLATRLLSRLRQALGVELPVQAVFESPTVAGLAGAVAAAGGRGAGAAPPPLAPLPRQGGPLPLSYAQQRLWFMQRLAPESATYNIPSGFRLRGPLDRAALAAALAEILRRHEVLRTRIVEARGEPGQEVCPPAPPPAPALPLADLGGLPAERREAELARLWRREGGRTFDLARGPMLRATLVRLARGEHVLLLTLHHVASDGWSAGVLHRELSALYAAALARRPSPLARPALQYADYAAWQRAWPEEILAGQLAYWRDRLAGTAALELPADRARPPVQSFRGKSQPLDLPPGLAVALRQLARGRRATLFMTLLTAWQALLHRLSGQDGFAVGTPVANRTRPELEALVGLFTNTLVLRAEGGGDPSFAELLERVRGRALEAYDHADVPFERLVDELNPARDRSRQPLVQTMLALDSAPAAPLALEGLAVAELPWSGAVSRFDVSLGLAERSGRLAGQLEYSTDLFDAASAARLVGHLVHLLAAVAVAPERRLGEVELLSPAERQQLVVELNDTETVYFADHRLHRWLERQAARTPGHLALVGEGESLSYGELNARANRLARHLRALGVEVGSPVAICAERSAALVVGLLAILKAGGAYLPLDPSYPPERLAFMVEDGLAGTPSPVLLAQARWAPLLDGASAAVGARLVDLDAAADLASGEGGDLEGGAGPDDLAYVIYTSGSTGRPKGVMNTHRGIVNRLLWMQQAYGLGAADRVLQKTPVSFDVSVWELFWPLATGARLVLARPGGHRDPTYLARLIAEQGVTTLHFVPAMLQVFLEQPDLDRCRSLRRVMASGEALPAELARRFFARLGGLGAGLHNLYGPTEAAVDVTFHACSPEAAYRAVPIGRPIANSGIWLLDAGLRPVSLGVPGELYIGGAGLARGYLRRPELTAERFVPRPFGGRPGERLYRTGDLARHLPGGEIEFLGRTDHQVKLRGFRVEPGEIEAALARHPRVLEAAVVAREERPGELRLVAYVVQAPPPEPLEPLDGELREALRRVLPDYMVPADFVVLEALPATPNGKLDRRALQAMPLPAARRAGELAPPETEVEALLVEIWQRLLGREPIGVYDNLFDLGAHSLLAPQFTAEVQEVFDLELPLHALFEAPTVRQLAVAIQGALLAEIEGMSDEEAARQAG